jgi:hypothetical protein
VGCLGRRLSEDMAQAGKVGNVLALGKIVYDIGNGSADASTIIDAGMLAISFTPVGAVIAISYGTADYFFDINDKIDAAIGRDSNIWKNEK